MGSDILVREQRGPVLLLTLNRPAVLNALNRDLVVALRDAFKTVASDQRTHVVLLTGAGRAFSSGADLAELDARYAAGDAALGQDLRQTYAPLIQAVRACPQPIVAAINGIAAGAGLSLALAADLRLAARSAQLVLAFIRIGLVPDAGALFFLSRLVGLGRATDMAMRGEAVTAEAALQMGLVSVVVADTALLDAALDRAAELAAKPAGALRLIKQGLRPRSSWMRCSNWKRSSSRKRRGWPAIGRPSEPLSRDTRRVPAPEVCYHRQPKDKEVVPMADTPQISESGA